MALQFESLKHINQKTKDLVSGYIKNMEKELNGSIIPSLIITTCILFFHAKEFFSKIGKFMMTDDESLTTLRVSSNVDNPDSQKIARNSAYGSVVIHDKHHCIYVWTIKILKVDVFDTFIGMDSSNKKYINANFTLQSGYDKLYKYYAIDHCGLKYGHIEGEEEYGIRFGVNSVVRMEVNTKDKTIEYWINGKSQGVAFENVDFDDCEYYFAVSLCTNEYEYAHCVKLIDFQQKFI